MLKHGTLGIGKIEHTQLHCFENSCAHFSKNKLVQASRAGAADKLGLLAQKTAST